MVTIEFGVERTTDVSLRIYDVSGRLVRSVIDEIVAAGRHRSEWDRRNSQGQIVASGIYVVRMKIGDGQSFHRKIALAE